MIMKRFTLILLLATGLSVGAIACSSEPPAGTDAGSKGEGDAGVEDGGAGDDDGGIIDPGVDDGGVDDAGVDGGIIDAGPDDGGVDDAGVDGGMVSCDPGYRPDGDGGCELNEPALDDPDLELWLDASDAATITLDNGNVYDWQDRRRIGNLNLFTTASLPERPALVPSAWNGRSVVEFVDGNKLTYSGFQGFNGASAYTILAVVSHTGSGDQGIVTFSNGGQLGIRVAFTGDGTTMSFLHRWPVADTGGVDVNLTNVPTGDAHIVTAFRVGGGEVPGLTLASSDAMSLEGGSETVIQPSTDVDGTGAVTLGGDSGTGIQGRIAEVLIFSRRLSAQELQDVREYLNAKWGVLP